MERTGNHNRVSLFYGCNENCKVFTKFQIHNCRNLDEMSFGQGRSEATTAATTLSTSAAVAVAALVPAKNYIPPSIATRTRMTPKGTPKVTPKTKSRIKRKKKSRSISPNSPITDDDEFTPDTLPSLSVSVQSTQSKSQPPDVCNSLEIENITASFKKHIEDL